MMIGIPLRVRYNHMEYMYYVLSSPNKNYNSFEILLEGKNHLLILDEQEVWNEGEVENNNKLEPGLIQAIGKAIVQHYRVKKRGF
jgi:hypothetical protein